MKRCSDGFTLLEVLVALAVLALSAAALIKQTGLGLQQARLLEDKYVASLLVETRLNEELLKPDLPSEGSHSERIEYEGQQWKLEIEVSSTARADMRRIEVSAQPDDTSAKVGSVRLVAFKGQH